MLIDTYTLPELLDLALQVPETGTVNFNILHTVIKTIIEETNLSLMQPFCNIEDPIALKAALARVKNLKKSSSEESEVKHSDSDDERQTELLKETNMAKRMEAAEGNLVSLNGTTEELVGQMKELKHSAHRMMKEMKAVKHQLGAVAERHHVDVTATVESETEEMDDTGSLSSVMISSEEIKRLDNRIDELESTLKRTLAKSTAATMMAASRFHKLAPSKDKLSDIMSDDDGDESSRGRGLPKSLTQDLNQRFEDVWDELDRMGLKLAKFVEDEEIFDKAVSLERMILKLKDETESHLVKIDLLEADGKSRAEAIDAMQKSIEDLSFSKVDKEDFEEALHLKADKKDLDLKVGKADFENTVEDIGEALRDLLERLVALENNFEAAKDDIYDELGKKLYVSDYEKLQIPVMNRIRSLMHSFKNLKTMISTILFPDAAAVTKCICCGRPGDLAEGKYSEGGDACRLGPRPTPDNLTINDLIPHDHDRHGKSHRKDKSVVSLPSENFAPSAQKFGKGLVCKSCHHHSSSKLNKKFRNRKESCDDPECETHFSNHHLKSIVSSMSRSGKKINDMYHGVLESIGEQVSIASNENSTEFRKTDQHSGSSYLNSVRTLMHNLLDAADANISGNCPIRISPSKSQARVSSSESHTVQEKHSTVEVGENEFIPVKGNRPQRVSETTNNIPYNAEHDALEKCSSKAYDSTRRSVLKPTIISIPLGVQMEKECDATKSSDIEDHVINRVMQQRDFI